VLPYTDPVPESTMRWFRPIGMALLALLIAAPLSIAVDFVAGPLHRDHLQYVILGLGAVVFFPLMRYSRHRRKRDATRAQTGIDGPPGGASLMVAGILALALCAAVLLLLPSREGQDPRELVRAAALFGAGGAVAIGVGFKRIRDRRRLRAARRRLG
jgi:hypothetical protein